MGKIIGFSGAPRDVYCQQAAADPNYLGCKRGARQDWPVFRTPPPQQPNVPGGTCPPYAPLTPIHWCMRAYTCVEQEPTLRVPTLDTPAFTPPRGRPRDVRSMARGRRTVREPIEPPTIALPPSPGPVRRRRSLGIEPDPEGKFAEGIGKAFLPVAVAVTAVFVGAGGYGGYSYAKRRGVSPTAGAVAGGLAGAALLFLTPRLL